MTTAAFAPAAAPRTGLRRIGPLLGLVVAAHVLLLMAPRQAAVAQGTRPPAPASILVRVLEAPPARILAATLASVAAEAPAKVPAIESSAPLPAPEAPAEVARPPLPEVLPAMPKAETWLGLSLPGAATDDDLYFPRAQLAVVPTPIGPVTIDYPPFDGDEGRYVAELSLFVDERGQVVRVRVDDGPLPPALEEAARRAFMQARFRPGEAAEHGVVKSRIRVEVRFDSGPR